VGGSTSSDVLSMKLKVNLRNQLESWSYKRQRYVREKTLSNETVKLKTETGHAYYGVEQFAGGKNDILVLAYYETKNKDNPRQYVWLTINFDGDVKEKNIDVPGSYSMVFCKEFNIGSDDNSNNSASQIVVILAPNKGDLTKYVYLSYDGTGNLKNKVEFTSPASALLVNSVDEKDGDIYLFAMSKKGTNAYNKVFEEYAPIYNPGYSSGGNNYQDDKYNRSANQSMDNFHMLKFSGNELAFATTTSTDDLDKVAKFAPNEKKGKVYKGKKFGISNFEVTPAKEYLVAGQLIFKVNIGSLKDPNFVEGYGDLVCLQFDSNGKLKANYAVDKVFEDKKSEIFDMPQRFYISPDGKYAYWEISEVKGFSGYNSWSDAYNGRKTYRPRFFPRVTKIDLQAATLGEFKYIGNKKFFVYRDGMIFNAATNTITFVGRDEDHENLWLAQLIFN